MGAVQGTESSSLGDVKGREHIKKDMEDIIKSNNADEAKEQIKELLEKWKTIPVNVCLLGERGTGKSSFINNMIGEERAKTGVKETTSDATKYSHPDNEKLCFWDLPGFGARRYPTVTKYLQAMDMQRFDLILFLHKNTFKPNDAALTREIKSIGIPLFILRTHFDIDTQGEPLIENVKEDILAEIRSYNLSVVKATEKVKATQNKCYFVSNLSHGFDYEVLFNDLFHALENSDKKDAMAFSIWNRNRTILRIKKKRLEERILIVSGMAAAAGAIPVPGMDEQINTAIMVDEIVMMATILSISNFIEGNDKMECVKECSDYLNKNGLMNLMETISDNSSVMIGDDILKSVPIIGPIIGGILSSTTNFILAKTTLTKVLNAFVSVAEKKLESEES